MTMRILQFTGEIAVPFHKDATCGAVGCSRRPTHIKWWPRVQGRKFGDPRCDQHKSAGQTAAEKARNRL